MEGIIGADNKASIKLLDRSKAEELKIQVPAEALVPYVGYPVCEFSVLANDDSNKYLGTLRGFSDRVYFFDVADGIADNQLENVLAAVEESYPDAREFYIEYPGSKYDQLSKITKRHKQLGVLKLAYCQDADSRLRLEKATSKTLAGNVIQCENETIEEGERESKQWLACALYYHQDIELYPPRKFNRLFKRNKMQSFIDKAARDGDTEILDRIENTARYSKPSNATQSTKGYLVVVGFKLASVGNNFVGSNKESDENINAIYGERLLSDIDKYGWGSHERGKSIQEVYGNEKEPDLVTLEKLHKVVIDERRHLETKKGTQRRFVFDVVLRFLAPTIVGIASALIANWIIN